MSSAQIDVENAPVGQQRIKLDKDDFQILINYNNGKQFPVKSFIEPGSIEWVRVKENMLTPRARLKISLKTQNSLLAIKYKNKITSFQGSQNRAFSELYISLYEKDPIQIFYKNQLWASLIVKPKKPAKARTLIDYTCSRNGISVEGLTHEHITLGCHTRRIGNFGEEKPMLEVMWLSPELKVLDQESVPYYASFLIQYPISVQVQNIYTKEIKTITFKARVPKRLHRMFTAYGFGPYAFNTKTKNETGNTLTNKVDMATALFFYLNYKISDTTSVRGFDAAVLNESKFNNAGIYVGSDFGFSFDNRLYFTTLLGVQYLYFQFDDDSDEISEAIFPQGIEFMYRHVFGIPNYIVSGGIFLSTTDSVDYENVWVRWGKNYFWELNLITWGKEDFETRTWGVSVGFPFKGFL